MNHLADAHAFIEPIAAARRNRGRHVTDEHLQRAAALLADLWAAAARQGITPDHWGYHAHLPRAALDTISAPSRRPPAGRQRRPQPRQHWQEVDH